MAPPAAANGSACLLLGCSGLLLGLAIGAVLMAALLSRSGVLVRTIKENLFAEGK